MLIESSHMVPEMYKVGAIVVLGPTKMWGPKDLLTIHTCSMFIHFTLVLNLQRNWQSSVLPENPIGGGNPAW